MYSFVLDSVLAFWLFLLPLNFPTFLLQLPFWTVNHHLCGNFQWLSFTYRTGCKSLSLSPASLASVQISRFIFMSPYIQYFCHAEYDHPPINASMWCLETILSQMFHLPSPLSQEMATPFILLLRSKSCSHTYLPFLHIPTSRPSLSSSKYVKNMIILLLPHTTPYRFPGSQDGL